MGFKWLSADELAGVGVRETLKAVPLKALPAY
jgi:hypothetical protein